MRLRRRLPLPLPPDPECHVVGEVLQAYLDGELGPEDAELVAEHLEHCERCGIEAATVERVVDAIKRQRPDLDPEAIGRLTGFVDRLTRDDAAGGPSAPSS
ncbi:MAG: zf-HC2 domain-containing protein [Nitriliruptor sp.]|uniref:anti-sigma factor n=1 Tax=Nitriliruptor sp. TaxID=2448056 RepID=UPI0034A0AEBA